MDLMPKFESAQEAIQVWHCATLGGDALVGYLKRAREKSLQELLKATGEQIVRLQGSVKALDELLQKLAEARETAEKLDVSERRARR